MDHISEQDLDMHVRIVGWLHILGSGFLALVGLFLLVFLPGIGAAAEDPAALRVLAILGPALCIFLAALAAPGVVAGFGLLKKKSWARVLAIIVGILNLMNFPIGTAIGLYTLWVLMQNNAADYFSEHSKI